MLTAEEYVEVSTAKTSEILAVPINMHGQTHRQGLIVVRPKSRLQKVSDLKGLRFHFMPAGDVLNEAAMGALLEAGVQPKEVDKGLLGLELDTSHINSMEVAKSVVLEDAAGVIDEMDYNRWPEKGGSLVLLSPSKEQVRIIGKTVRVPEGPFVASLQAPAELRDKVRRYLLEDLKKKTFVLGVLGVSGFAPAIDPSEYEPYFAVHRKLHPNRFSRPQVN
jgi:ABC-type phosphate/phosphonate transport system substrate-binding protein